MQSPAGNTVLVARPLWPVLRKLCALLPATGYRVEESRSWARLLESSLVCKGLSGVILGETGDAQEEMEIVRRFRERTGALGVPLILVGGMNAFVRAAKFQAAGVDVILAADASAEEILERARPLLRFGSLYQATLAEARELKDLSYRDELTGLPNRRHFSMDLARHAELTRRTGRPLSCIIIDIDDFRKINDTLGTTAGDRVIRQFGKMVEGSMRRYDILARLGGDEFGWLLVDADPGKALQAAERTQRMICGSAFEAGAEPLRVTATFGVSSLKPGEMSAADLVGNADRALYWGKESGKNVIRFYPSGKPGENHAKGNSHVS